MLSAPCDMVAEVSAQQFAVAVEVQNVVKTMSGHEMDDRGLEHDLESSSSLRFQENQEIFLPYLVATWLQKNCDLVVRENCLNEKIINFKWIL